VYRGKTRNEQVDTSVCCNNFVGSSANVTLFSSRKILLFWKFVIGCGGVVSRAGLFEIKDYQNISGLHKKYFRNIFVASYFSNNRVDLNLNYLFIFTLLR